MPFNPAVRAYATAWKNNCAFHCLTHFLVDEIESNPLSTLEKQYSEEAYQLFLKIFAETYFLPEATLPFLQRLVKQYINPLDREAIFGPVLRKCLGELIKQRRNPEDFVASFRADVISYLKNKQGPFANPYAIEANKEWLEVLSVSYRAQSAELQKQLGGLEADPEMFVTPEIIRDFWLTQGFERYASHLGNSGATISPEEFSTLTQALGVGLRVFSASNRDVPFFPNAEDKHKKQRVLTVFNGGRHWEYEATDSIIAYTHNIPYQGIEQINNLITESAYPDRQKIKKLAEESEATFYGILMPLEDQALIPLDITLALQGLHLSLSLSASLDSDLNTGPVPKIPSSPDKHKGKGQQASAAAVDVPEMSRPVSSHSLGLDPRPVKPDHVSPVLPASQQRLVLEKKEDHEEDALDLLAIAESQRVQRQRTVADSLTVSFAEERKDKDERNRVKPVAQRDDGIRVRPSISLSDDQKYRDDELRSQAAAASQNDGIRVRPTMAWEDYSELEGENLLAYVASQQDRAIPGPDLSQFNPEQEDLNLKWALRASLSTNGNGVHSAEESADRTPLVQQPKSPAAHTPLSFLPSFTHLRPASVELPRRNILEDAEVDRMGLHNGHNGHNGLSPTPEDDKSKAEQLKNSDKEGYIHYLEERVRTLEATVKAFEAAEVDRKLASAEAQRVAQKAQKPKAAEQPKAAARPRSAIHPRPGTNLLLARRMGLGRSQQEQASSRAKSDGKSPATKSEPSNTSAAAFRHHSSHGLSPARTMNGAKRGTVSGKPGANSATPAVVPAKSTERLSV